MWLNFRTSMTINQEQCVIRLSRIDKSTSTQVASTGNRESHLDLGLPFA